MHRARIFIGLGLSLTLLGYGGCKAEETEKHGSLALGPSCDDGSCVEHNGLSHCPLGKGEVVSADGKYVEVTGMRSAGVDGVSISLPEVTSFNPSGFHEADGDSQMIARAFSDGSVASTLTDVTSGHEVTLSASFTGNGNKSTYSAIFTRAGEEVARISRIRTGAEVPTPLSRPCRPPECPPRYVAPFKNNRHVQGALPGSCSWTVRFDEEDPSTIQLADGEVVEIDQVELLEELPAKGSYSYLGFDRIDYTYDGGKLTLTEEELH